MNMIFLLSVILKGIGAVLEIVLQILITDQTGVSGYGMYSTWINAADLLFWVCFSGLVKCNTFYLSGKDTSISKFKQKYYGMYVVPVLFLVMCVSVFITKSILPCIVIGITCLELFVLDNSSTLLARGKSVTSLIGEYVMGRMVLVIGVVAIGMVGSLQIYTLLGLYIFQYVLIIGFFLLRKKKAEKEYRNIADEVSIKKWSAYQKADLMHSMIEQMPVVVQYFFAGAFEAGVVSIVLLVKKLINFISGPTAKIFLPEFSRLYHAGEKVKICNYYATIMRIQMLIVAPLAVVLLGYPHVILQILASELVEQARLFVVCSIIFLLVATLGPCGGILQMTGNEKVDNRCREVALLGMLCVMLLTRNDSYFVLYGLCSQIAMEAVAKYIYVSYWMEKSPVTLKTYVSWWFLPCVVIGVTYGLHLQYSFWAMLLLAGMVFAIRLLKELKNEGNDIFKKVKEGMKG